MSFGGGYSPPSPYRTKSQKVTKWKRLGDIQPGEGGETYNYEYRTQPPGEGESGWESYEDTIQVIDESPTEAESATDKAKAEEAARNEAILARKRKGRRSTLLTGGQGVTYQPMLGKSYLTGKTALGQ